MPKRSKSKRRRSKRDDAPGNANHVTANGSNGAAPNGHAEHAMVAYVLGGAGAAAGRHPERRDLPLLERGQAESEAAHARRVMRQLDRAVAAGGTHLVIPREHADWLEENPRLVAQLAARHRLVEAARSGPIVLELGADAEIGLQAVVEGWEVVPGEELHLIAPRRLEDPLLTIQVIGHAQGPLRGALTLRAEGVRTIRVRFHLGRPDRREPHYRDLYLSLARPGWLIHELPFVEATFAKDGTLRLEFDLRLDRGRALERMEIAPVEEDNWRMHPMYPDGASITLPAVVPAGAQLCLSQLTLARVPRTRKGPSYGIVQASQPAPFRTPPEARRDAVIFSSWVPEDGLSLGDYFIETLRRWHGDSRIFVGINHGSSPRWRARLEGSGLDLVIRDAAREQTLSSDVPGFVAALDAYRREREPFDLVWFGHTKGLSHVEEFWYATGRWTIERMFWSRREEITQHFAPPLIGLYSPHYLMLLQDHLRQTDALRRMYQAPCAPLGMMAVATHFVTRGEIVREFCARVDPRVFREGPQAFGGNAFFFEMAMPNVPLMQGYEPAIEPGLGGTSGSPAWDDVASVLNDWRQNNAVVAIELEKWRRDPTRFRTRHAEHNRID